MPDLEPTNAELLGEFAHLKLEWAETLDLIQRWAGRQAKRDATDARRRLAESGNESVGPAHESARAIAETPGTGQASRSASHSVKSALRTRSLEMLRRQNPNIPPGIDAAVRHAQPSEDQESLG